MQSFAARPLVNMIHHFPHELPSISSLPTNSALQGVLSAQTRHVPRRHAIPAAWYRAGTSKGLFFHRAHLPKDQSAWHPVILSAMGSEDGDAKQINGMGGGTSTTSKVAIVSRSSRKDVDLEYTFVQVVPDSGRLDMSGNCGNIASGVAPFALDEGIITPPPGQESVAIRILNTNTNKIMESLVHLDIDGHAYDSGSYLMPGIKSGGSPIRVSFLEPAGSMTGKMFPTGNTEDWIHVSTGLTSFSVRATLVDVANPFVLVDFTTLPKAYQTLGPQTSASLQLVEEIRRAAAVQMGLAKDVGEAARTRGTPKIAIVNEPGSSADVCVTAFSAGRTHPTVQLTGAVCLAAAVSTPNTVVWRMAQSNADRAVDAPESGRSTPSSLSSVASGDSELVQASPMKHVRVKHAGGTIEADVSSSVSPRDRSIRIDRVTITRTARRLFEGNVFYQS